MSLKSIVLYLTEEIIQSSYSLSTVDMFLLQGPLFELTDLHTISIQKTVGPIVL